MYDRIMRWFHRIGLKEGNPEEIILDEGDKLKRKLAKGSLSHIATNSSISRRSRKMSMLHISLDFEHGNTIWFDNDTTHFILVFYNND